MVDGVYSKKREILSSLIYLFSAHFYDAPCFPEMILFSYGNFRRFDDLVITGQNYCDLELARN